MGPLAPYVLHIVSIMRLCVGESWLTSWGYRADPPVDHKELMKWGNEAAAAIKSIRGTKYEVGSAGSTLYFAGNI